MTTSSTLDAKYSAALRQILKFEGGYVDDPVDPGGATNFGITQRTYDSWRRRQDIKIPFPANPFSLPVLLPKLSRQEFLADCRGSANPLRNVPVKGFVSHGCIEMPFERKLFSKRGLAVSHTSNMPDELWSLDQLRQEYLLLLQEVETLRERPTEPQCQSKQAREHK